MYQITTDSAKNRVIIKLEGMMGAEEMAAAGEKLMAAIAKLKPGFDCINDISGAKTASEEAASRLGKIQAAVAQAGVRRVVRVVGSRLVAMQFVRTAAGLPYKVSEAESIEAAHALLDKAAAD
jgi:hypothetical protein